MARHSRATSRQIWCTGCGEEVAARLTDGKERYPHRPDLYHIPFWKCDTCGAWVGCHWKTTKPTTPLGYLATPEILDARIRIHSLIDPLWQPDKKKRGHIYARMTKKLGYKYHTGEIKSMEQARIVWQAAAEVHNELLQERQMQQDVFTIR